MISKDDHPVRLSCHGVCSVSDEFATHERGHPHIQKVSYATVVTNNENITGPGS